MVQKQIIGLITLVIAVLSPAVAFAGEPPNQPLTFATWDIFEADKCASIWLIKRHITTEAEIRFFHRDENPPQGILFDTPDAEFRRYHNKSTYETLLEHYGLTDKTLVYIGRIIHDIEVNTWERKVMNETLRVETEVVGIFGNKQPEKAVKACIEYFDTLYDSTSRH